MSALYMFFCNINIPGTENFSVFIYKVKEAYANYNLSGSKFERSLYIFMTHSFKFDLNNDRRKNLIFFFKRYNSVFNHWGKTIFELSFYVSMTPPYGKFKLNVCNG